MEAAIAQRPSQIDLEQPAVWQALRGRFRADGSHDNLPQQRGFSEQDLKQIDTLQQQFGEATGIRLSGHDLINRSFNPIIDVWHLDQVQDDPKRFTEYLRLIGDNIYTNLKERLFAVETYGTFTIQNGELYAEVFPDEPFSQVLFRGAEYRAKHNSPEQEREGTLGEIGGWDKINSYLANPETLPGSTVVSLSPPGIVEKTSYDGRYIDIFKKAIDTEGKLYVKRIRYAVDYDDEKYAAVANALMPGFFNGLKDDGRPLDAWYLSHPIAVAGKLPEWIFPKTAMNNDTFEGIYQHVKDSGLVDFYKKTAAQRPINWVELAKAFNTILTVTDRLKEGKSLRDILPALFDSSRRGVSVGRIFEQAKEQFAMAMVAAFGKQKVQKVGGGGCPANRGLDFAETMEAANNLTSPAEEFLKNSVAQFAGADNPDGKGSLKFHCEKCDEDHTRPWGGYVFSCPVTGDAYENCA